MLKFLRKYNKWILVVGGSLLMVAFLAPQAIQNMPKLSDPVAAEYNGESVKASRLEEADAELRAVNALGGTGGLADLMLGLSAPSGERYMEWYMLTREAEEAGFVGSDQDGATLYPQIAQELAMLQAREVARQNGFPESFASQLAPQYAEAWLNRIAGSENGAASAGRYRTLEELHKAVAKLRGVLRMRAAYSTVGRLSTSRATRSGADIFNGATVDYVVIPSERFLDSVAEPTEEEIRAHFETYADKLPSETEYGIGYRQPQRVKLEWLAIEREPIENAITIDAVEASKYQQLNKDKYPGSFSEERPSINAELKRQKAQQIIAQAENAVRAEMLRATRTLERRDGYVSLPGDWQEQHPTLETIAQHVVEQIKEANDGLVIPLPKVTIRNSAWLDQQEVYAIEGFGPSMLRVGSTQVPAVAAVFSVRELNPNPNVPVQAGLLASEFPTQGEDGTRYFFRVLDARKVSAPETLGEVRDEVVQDLKRIEAYERVVSELGSYTEVAINAGLEQVVEAVNAGLPSEDEATVGETPDRVSITEGATILNRIGQATPPVFRDEDVLEAVFAVSRPLDPTKKIEDVALPERTFATPAPKSLAVVVGRIAGLEPLTREDFASGYAQLSSIITQLEVNELESNDNPFTYERLKARHNWVDKDPRRSGDGAGDEG